ncbi:MAG: serine/threonine protein kinase, partial [Verrucomicrobiae bacterium]|nr:serine/threonine protein kinase [Verrucomicrobiae bacterium]
VNVETRTRVALKVIHGMLAGDAQVRGRFKREAAILRRLDGPHVCPLLDFGEVPDPRRKGENLLYMALARVDGLPLDRWHVTRSNVTMDAIVRIVADVCRGLDAAHSRGIVHRDLKPSNIMMASDDRAIVVDFGLAKIIAGTGGPGTTALTQHNMVFGTPEYMSPEQARGDAIDGRTDIYSFGIVVYELLTGETP